MQFSSQPATKNRQWRHQSKGAPPQGINRSGRRLLRTVRVAVPAMLVLSLFIALPALATDESTLIEESNTSAGVEGDPRTDGNYVVWNHDSTSVHSSCQSLWVEGADIRIARVEQTSGYAVDQGHLLLETPAIHCQDYDSEQLEGGVFVLNLETGARQTLTADAENVERVAFDYPYAAWATIEELATGAEQLTIWAMNIEADDQPIEVDVDDIGSGGDIYLFVENETVYWITTYGSTSVGNAARAPIGGDTRYFKSMHDTGEVALAGDLLVTQTEGRALLHPLSGGQPRWLSDGDVHNLATDGRYVFWSPGASMGTEIIGFDTLTNSRFEVWTVQSDDPDHPGYIGSIDASGGKVVWQHRGYDFVWTSAVHGAVISSRLPSTSQPDPGTTSPDWTYYPETGHYLANDFRDFWDNNGGLPVFGYPMTEEFDYLSPETGNAHAAQMTERQRFEWHPDNIGTPYAVLLGRLGETILQEQGRDWQQFAKADPSAEHYFEATGHAIAPEFYTYWSSHGLDLGHAGVSFEESVALFGFPLSEPMMETNADGDTVLTQYFERAVFEHHPANPESSQVLLRRLGAELVDSWGW